MSLGWERFNSGKSGTQMTLIYIVSFAAIVAKERNTDDAD